MGRTETVCCRIYTGDARPICQSSRRPPPKQVGVDMMLKDMKGLGLIESDTLWSSPFIPVREKNGDYGFCVESWRPNKITEKECSPLRRTDDTLDTIAGAKWFSILDLKNACWKITLNSTVKEKQRSQLAGVVAVHNCTLPLQCLAMSEVIIRHSVCAPTQITPHQLGTTFGPTFQTPKLPCRSKVTIGRNKKLQSDYSHEN
jgi:hypothetical protein